MWGITSTTQVIWLTHFKPFWSPMEYSHLWCSFTLNCSGLSQIQAKWNLSSMYKPTTCVCVCYGCMPTYRGGLAWVPSGRDTQTKDPFRYRSLFINIFYCIFHIFQCHSGSWVCQWQWNSVLPSCMWSGSAPCHFQHGSAWNLSFQSGRCNPGASSRYSYWVVSHIVCVPLKSELWLDVTPLSVTDNNGSFCASFEVRYGRVFEVLCQSSRGSVTWTMVGDGSEGPHYDNIILVVSRRTGI